MYPRFRLDFTNGEDGTKGIFKLQSGTKKASHSSAEHSPGFGWTNAQVAKAASYAETVKKKTQGAAQAENVNRGSRNGHGHANQGQGEKQQSSFRGQQSRQRGDEQVRVDVDVSLGSDKGEGTQRSGLQGQQWTSTSASMPRSTGQGQHAESTSYRSVDYKADKPRSKGTSKRRQQKKKQKEEESYQELIPEEKPEGVPKATKATNKWEEENTLMLPESRHLETALRRRSDTKDYNTDDVNFFGQQRQDRRRSWSRKGKPKRGPMYGQRGLSSRRQEMKVGEEGHYWEDEKPKPSETKDKRKKIGSRARARAKKGTKGASDAARRLLA